MTRSIMILVFILNGLFVLAQKQAKFITNLNSHDSLFFWVYRSTCDGGNFMDSDFFAIVKKGNIFTMTFISHKEPKQTLTVVLDSTQVACLKNIESSKQFSTSFDVYTITEYNNGKKRHLKEIRRSPLILDEIKTFFNKNPQTNFDQN